MNDERNATEDTAKPDGQHFPPGTFDLSFNADGGLVVKHRDPARRPGCSILGAPSTVLEGCAGLFHHLAAHRTA